MNNNNQNTIWNFEQSTSEEIPTNFSVPTIDTDDLEAMANSEEADQATKQYQVQFDESCLALVIA